MGYIYLVRHAQTSWNVAGRYQGRRDIPLDIEGLRQARALADYLNNEQIKAVYTSPLLRSYETACVVAEQKGCKVEESSDLAELSYGEWEGLTRQEVEERFPETFRQWHTDPTGIKMPGGESLDDLRNRVLPLFAELIRRHDNEPILIVTHAAVIKIILCYMLGLEFSRYWQLIQENCAINIFNVHKFKLPRILLLNGTFHVRQVLCHPKGK